MSQIFRAQKSPRGAGLGGNSFMFLTAVVVFRPKAVLLVNVDLAPRIDETKLKCSRYLFNASDFYMRVVWMTQDVG